MEYEPVDFEINVSIDKIVSAHYFNLKNDYSFSGEMHDFWEFIYIDFGALRLNVGNREIELNTGELYLHKPLEFHAEKNIENKICRSVVFSFTSNSHYLYKIAGRPIALSDNDKVIVAKLVLEAGFSYETPMDQFNVKKLTKRKFKIFGSEQLLKNGLESLMLEIIRREIDEASYSKGNLLQNTEDKTCKEICDFLKNNTDKNYDFNDICKEFNIGNGALKRLFHTKVGYGVMEYFQLCKIDKAKQYIREKAYSINEISEMLGYSSIYYFSKKFKLLVGITPTDYKKSIVSMEENRELEYNIKNKH